MKFVRLWLHSAFRFHVNGFLKMLTEKVQDVGAAGDKPLSLLRLPPERHPRPSGTTVV